MSFLAAARRRAPSSIKTEPEPVHAAPADTVDSTNIHNMSPARTTATVASDGPANATAVEVRSPGRRAPTFTATTAAEVVSVASASHSSTTDASNNSAAIGTWRPPQWETVLANIESMRAQHDAPVDTMGCDQCADPDAPPAVRRYQILLSLMLSSQTKDEVTFSAMQRLRGAGAATPSAVVALPQARLEELLYPVSFYKNKAKYILATSRVLLDSYGGDIPDTVDELVALAGVGPKMAHLAMHSAWNKQEGIGVDIHVHRISNRLGWVGPGVRAVTATPEATRAALEDWLPRDRWPTLNHLLVGFGQQVCTPIQPHCDVCLNKNICPVGRGARPSDIASSAARKRAR